MTRAAYYLRLFLALVTSALAVLAVTALILSIRYQNRITDASRYNDTFDFTQTSSEFLRLQMAIAARFSNDASAAAPEIGLRYDIMRARVKALLVRTVDIGGSQATFRDLDAAMKAVAPLIERLDSPDAAERAIAILQPLNKRFARLSSMAHAEAGDVIARRQIELLWIFAGVCAIVVALIVFGFALLGFVFRQHAKAVRIARKDELTGIDNRFALNQKLLSIKARGNRAILLLDVDHFKDINDTLGHLLGDQFLLALSKRLAAVSGEASLFARLGGDEFAILFEGASADVQVRTCAEAILRCLREPLVIDGHLLRAGVSMGIAVLGHDDDQNDVTLMKNADLALYAAKADGRACYRVFDPAMDRALQRRQQLLNGLSQAIGAGELFLVFQPIVALKDQRIAGFEALLRWRHPEMGLVSPAEFIPVAEESGLILDIGRWVIDEACRVAALWPERMTISVNVSGRQFADSHLYDCIEEALTRHRISAPRLTVELTESILIEHDEDVWDVLLRLRNLGVVVSLDDFGTGYASLGYLRRFAFDRLKIDQSFVRSSESDPSSLAIVSAICGLAQSLDLKIVAEGIETQDHCDLVLAAGCHFGQGYLFDRPLSADAATWRVAPGHGLTAAVAANAARPAPAEPEALPIRREVA